MNVEVTFQSISGLEEFTRSGRFSKKDPLVVVKVSHCDHPLDGADESDSFHRIGVEFPLKNKEIKLAQGSTECNIDVPQMKFCSSDLLVGSTDVDKFHFSLSIFDNKVASDTLVLKTASNYTVTFQHSMNPPKKPIKPSERNRELNVTPTRDGHGNVAMYNCCSCEIPLEPTDKCSNASMKIQLRMWLQNELTLHYYKFRHFHDLEQELEASLSNVVAQREGIINMQRFTHYQLALREKMKRQPAESHGQTPPPTSAKKTRSKRDNDRVQCAQTKQKFETLKKRMDADSPTREEPKRAEKWEPTSTARLAMCPWRSPQLSLSAVGTSWLPSVEALEQAIERRRIEAEETKREMELIQKREERERKWRWSPRRPMGSTREMDEDSTPRGQQPQYSVAPKVDSRRNKPYRNAIQQLNEKPTTPRKKQDNQSRQETPREEKNESQKESTKKQSESGSTPRFPRITPRLYPQEKIEKDPDEEINFWQAKLDSLVEENRRKESKKRRSTSQKIDQCFQ